MTSGLHQPSSTSQRPVRTDRHLALPVVVVVAVPHARNRHRESSVSCWPVLCLLLPQGCLTWLTRVFWQLSYRAREIFSTFLCSKATTPVNIDSQAQLADDILSAPHPDMFKEQQLQVSPAPLCRGRAPSSLSVLLAERGRSRVVVSRRSGLFLCPSLLVLSKLTLAQPLCKLGVSHFSTSLCW